MGGVLLLLLLRDAAAAEEEKEEGEEGKQEQQQFIIRARLGFRPSVRPSVSCVFSFSLKPVLSFSFFFLLRGGGETHTKKQDNPPTSSTARHYCLTIYSHEAINQSISSIHSFYTHTHSLST